MPEKWFGCMFCRSGQEIRLADTAELRWPGMKARAVCVLKRRSTGGVKSVGSEVMLPGYIFFEADDGFKPEPPLPDGILRILTTLDGDCALTGHDRWFAKWVLDQDGQIGMSRAHRVGDRVQIQKGPLKDLEGYIIRIDRRNRNGQIRLEMNGKEIKAWLPFEIIEEDSFVLDINTKTN